MSQLYRMLDAPDAPKAAIPVRDRAEARHWNTVERGFGIFWTCNEFAGARRKENLLKIAAWAVDMDVGTKAEMAAKLHASPLIPSAIVETKRGYQAYWAAADGKAEHWNAIVLERLVPHFGSDRNARDLCRILRAPGFLHLKDPADPFRCQLVWRRDVLYTERQMGEGFRWVPDRNGSPGASQRIWRGAATESGLPGGGEDFWEAVYKCDARQSLEALSGHWSVGGEMYGFRMCASGNLNITVNGKGCSCWIDKDGHIGSLSKGGPTAAQWLRYFGHDWKVVVEILKEIHPHLRDVDEEARKRYRSAA